MSANPLVAGPVDTSSALGGTMLVESLYDLSRAIESEDWVAAGLAGLSTVLDTAAAVMDPLGQLIAAGLGWLMEHVEPLKGWLNDLTGDAGAVLGFAGTWDNIATQMGSAAGDLDHLVAADLEGMRGQGIEAYARYASDFAEHLRGIGGSSTAVANSLRTCSTIVQVVHDLVRDAIAELVGAAISWAAQIVFTVGLGTPWVISQVATRVSSLAARVGSKVTGVITSARALGDLIDALKAAIRSLGDKLRSARPGGPGSPKGPNGPGSPGGPNGPDGPDGPRGPDGETPSPPRTWPDHPEPGTPEYDLGYDPAVGHFREAEYRTATRIIDERGIDLSRAPEGSRADWVDPSGRTYDAVGGFPGEYLQTPKQWRNFERQVVSHLDKADVVPIDVSQFDAQQIARIRELIADHGDRYFLVGE